MEQNISVTAVIAERIKAKSKPIQRKDNFKVGLIIEGGGMRGVIVGGMVVALEALEAVNAFDGIYTESAGSCAGAYFISEQATEGERIYYEDINNKKFINRLRLFIGKPVVDIPFLTYRVMKDVKPLNWKKIAESKAPLHIYVTSAKDGKMIDIFKFKTQQEVLDALHWTCRMPILAGMPSRISDQLYYTDGAVPNGGIPLDAAISDGCTHILVLLTRPQGTTGKGKFALEKIASYVLYRKFPKLAFVLKNSGKVYSQILKKIMEAEQNPENSQPKIEAIRIPTKSKHISVIEKNPKILIKGAREGYTAVIEKFEQYDLPIDGHIRIMR